MDIWKKIKIKTCKVTSQGLISLIQFLKRIHLNVIEKFGTSLVDNPDKYESLIPNDKADTDNQYSKMLKVALEMPKNNNIAITGTYGSGKSSFLRTFEKKHQEWEYLHLSLATFQDIDISNMKTEEPIKDGDSESPINSNGVKTQPKIGYEQLNQILEKSILQQIFYKEKDKTIPFSRFKRINNIKKSSLIFHSIFIGMFFLYSLAILLPEKVHQFFMCDVKEQILEYPFISWIMFLIFVFYFYKIFQYFMKLQVSKFNIKSGEIEVNNKDKTSILNEHLDEILYFFEVTSYNVVVIEDLDRFSNTEIYIKLREFNTLINNSKDINRRVVFVYAIKDDMFKDKDRTKFFDFIIPIIPYINSSNSFNQIKMKFENDNIDEEFLRNISLRIDDMRLLINIANEYKIYKHKIGSEKLNRERLLAMIIYKNFYPSDFAKLHVNEGNVYDIFNQRTKFIKEELEKNKQLQLKKSKEISELENKISLEKQKSITELRMVYILKIFETINNTSFFSNPTTHTLSDITKICKDDIFWQIVNAKVFARANGYQTQPFSEVEKAINPDFTYEEREKLIIEHPNEQLEQLKEDLQSLVENAKEIKKYNINQIAQIEDSKIFEKIEKENLLKFLIRDGFIREDYYDYISYFFPGSLTLKDRDFVLSVKDDKPLEFEYLLTNIDEVIKNLKAKDFESKAILNFNLLDYMLKENMKGDKLDNFTSNLSDSSDISKQFILSFLLITQEQDKFTKIVVEKFKNLWFHIFKESHLTFEKQKEYFQIFLEALDKITLTSLNVDNSIKVFIEENSYLPKYGASNDKFEFLILELQIKYKKLNIDESKNVALVVDYIFNNDLYELNQEMIEIYIGRFTLSDTMKNKLLISNYTTINELENTTYSLLKYIHQEINFYVENVLLKIPENTQESEAMILELLNNEDLELKNKKAIIKKEEAKISDISTVPNELWLDVLQENKLKASWDNLLYYYKEKNELDEYLLAFLNINENYQDLAKHKMNNREVFGDELLQRTSREILKSNQLSDESYSYLIKSIISKFTDLNIDLLSSIKVDEILANKKISLNQTTINSLKKNFPEKQIKLIESFRDEFLEKYEEFTLDEDNYTQILESNKFSKDEKFSIIETIDLKLLESEELVHKIIAFYIDIEDNISKDLFDKLFEISDRDNALKLLTKQIPELNNNEISTYLNQFELQYPKLTEISARPLKIPNTVINQNLVMALEAKRYISSKDILDKEIKINRRRK
jgi:hypothetical protein